MDSVGKLSGMPPLEATSGWWTALEMSSSKEVTGEWRISHNTELHILLCASNTIRVIKSRSVRCRTCNMHGEWRNTFNILVGRSEGRHKCSWEDHIT
jgi:hypothetical protein